MGVLLFLLCVGAIAQDTPMFRSRVELVMVPVVVRDKNGNAVGNLKREDFELFDERKPQVVSRFSVEKSEGEPVLLPPATPASVSERTTAAQSPVKTPQPTPVATPTRFIGYVFDDVHAEAADLFATRDAALKHIKTTLRNSDRAAVFTTSGMHMLDFTGDLEKVREALSALQPRSRQPGDRECPPITYYQADLIHDKHDEAALAEATSEAAICTLADGNTLRDPAKTAAARTVEVGGMETGSTLRLLRDLVRRMSTVPGQRMKHDGKFHTLRVAIRNGSGYQLQTRHGYYAPRQRLDAAALVKDDLLDALYSRDKIRDIPVDLETHVTGGKLEVVVRIDVRTLHYQKVDGRNADTLAIVAGVFDENAALVSDLERTLNLKLKDQTLAVPVASGVEVKAAFDLKPGKYIARLVVRDSEGQMVGSRNRAVEIP